MTGNSRPSPESRDRSCLYRTFFQALDPDVGEPRRRRVDAPLSSVCASNTSYSRTPIRLCRSLLANLDGHGDASPSQGQSPCGKHRSGLRDRRRGPRSTRIATFVQHVRALFDAIYGSPLLQGARRPQGVRRRSTPRTCQDVCVRRTDRSSHRRSSNIDFQLVAREIGRLSAPSFHSHA